MKRLQNNKTTGISLEKKLWDRIDTQRGDISRSRFILRLIEKSMKDAENLREFPA